MLQRYVHFVQCIHKTHSQHVKKIRGQDQGLPFRGQTLSRPRTGMLEAKAKDQGYRRKCSRKKRLQNFFSGGKGYKKCFSGNLQLRKTKKGLRKFSARFWRFPTKFQRFKKLCSPRAKDMAIFEALRLRGEGLQNVPSRTYSRRRTSSRISPLITGITVIGLRYGLGQD